jgi:hypothetical protein
MVGFVALLVTRQSLVRQMLWLCLEFSWQLARQSLTYIGSQAEPRNPFKNFDIFVGTRQCRVLGVA